VIRCRAFAPALEHGNRSNEEQNDRASGDNFHQHRLSVAKRNHFVAVRAVAQ
jgi:hypothetical protein